MTVKNPLWRRPINPLERYDTQSINYGVTQSIYYGVAQSINSLAVRAHSQTMFPEGILTWQKVFKN